MEAGYSKIPFLNKLGTKEVFKTAVLNPADQKKDPGPESPGSF
jgi:hypothetical protein